MPLDPSLGRWTGPPPARFSQDITTLRGAKNQAAGAFGAAMAQGFWHGFMAMGHAVQHHRGWRFQVLVAVAFVLLGALYKERHSIRASYLILGLCIFTSISPLTFPLYGYIAERKLAGGALAMAIFGVRGARALRRLQGETAADALAASPAHSRARGDPSRV